MIEIKKGCKIIKNLFIKKDISLDNIFAQLFLNHRFNYKPHQISGATQPDLSI